MFRSLPNFISHKRAYCLRPAPPLEKILHNNELPEYFSKIEAIEVFFNWRLFENILFCVIYY
jgi:hypothetical protein